jgi:hypothetical protein
VPWNPIGAIVGPLGVIALVFGRRKKGSKAGALLVLVVVIGSVGMTLAGCGGGQPAPHQSPTIPPASETPIPTPSPTPSPTQAPSPTVPPAPTNTPTETPCPPPFTNDNSWGNSWVQKQAHWEILKPILEKYQGDKWWGGSLPTTEEWTAYLIFMEGGILQNRNDKKLLAWILLYKIPRWDVAEYTPVTNPDVSTEFEQNNFTMDDWNKLIHPDPAKLREGFDIVQETKATYDTSKLPPYLYWVSKDEIEAAEKKTGKPVKFEFNHQYAPTVDGEFLVFLAAIDDFRKAFP